MRESRNQPNNSGDLRVLHVVSGDLWAGAEMQVWQLLRAARKAPNLKIRAVVLNPGLLVDRLAAENVDVTVLDESTQSFPQLAQGLRQLAKNWQPAVIHTHRRKEHILGALASMSCAAALVGTVHGRNEFETRQLGPRERILRGMERRILARMHDRLVAVSDDLAEVLPGRPGHAVVIPNSVDVEAVRMAATSTADDISFVDRIPIGFLGRLVQVKQVDHLLEMMVMLEERQPGRFCLHIIGDGPLGDSLPQRASQLDLGDAAIFHGFMPDPLALLSRMKLLLFASAHEGLPMTALEALSLGVPFVSPPIDSLSRLIAESGAGRVATSALPRDLAAAVLALDFKPGNDHGLRQSLLPERYRIENGLSATVRLWREVSGRASS